MNLLQNLISESIELFKKVGVYNYYCPKCKKIPSIKYEYKEDCVIIEC